MWGVIRADGVYRAVFQRLDQRLPVSGGFDGRVAFEFSLHLLVILIAEPKIVNGSLSCYVGIQGFGLTYHLDFLFSGHMEDVKVGAVFYRQIKCFPG